MARDSDTLSVSNIGGDLTIVGNVTSKGEINLDGHVRGDIHCVALVLGENSSVEGNVAADDVVIRGRLIGSVKALRVTLQSNSHVQGDLIHQSLAIEQGVSLRMIFFPQATPWQRIRPQVRGSPSWPESARRNAKRPSYDLYRNLTNIRSNVVA